MPIIISAIICTHNRANYLEKAIKSLVGQTIPRDEYEVIIVDNASTDGTRGICFGLGAEGKEHRAKGIEHREKQIPTMPSALCTMQYLYEPTLGLSQARNTGLKAAKGKYVAYLDDDAVASPDWLENIVNVLKSVDPRPGCVGGKIEPIWEAPRPSWLADDMLGQLSIQDWGLKSRFISKDEWLAGANLAYPRNILQEIGGFPVNLGRKGKKLLSMEENYVRLKIESLGYKYLYHPDVSVKHAITKERLNKKWFLRRAFWNGVSDAIINRDNIRHKLMKGIRIFGRMCLSISDLRGLLPSDQPDVFRRKCSVYARIGHVLAMWGIIR